HTSQVLGRVDSLTAGVVADLADPQTPAWSNLALMDQFLSTRGAADGPISSIAVMDSAGDVRGRSLASRLPYLNLADRDYFRVHGDDPSSQLYFGPAIVAVTGRVVIPVSRRISGLHGEFAGVVVVVLEPGYFERLYRSIEVGDGGVVALLHATGPSIVRVPVR